MKSLRLVLNIYITTSVCLATNVNVHCATFYWLLMLLFVLMLTAVTAMNVQCTGSQQPPKRPMWYLCCQCELVAFQLCIHRNIFLYFCCKLYVIVFCIISICLQYNYAFIICCGSILLKYISHTPSVCNVSMMMLFLPVTHTHRPTDCTAVIAALLSFTICWMCSRLSCSSTSLHVFSLLKRSGRALLWLLETDLFFTDRDFTVQACSRDRDCTVQACSKDRDCTVQACSKIQFFSSTRPSAIANEVLSKSFIIS